MKTMEYKGNTAFKRSMVELLKNHRMTNHVAEVKIGFEKDYIEKVSRGIKKLTLEDAIRIANFFNTTIDSVVHGNGNEIRVKNSHSSDVLTSQYFEECVERYVRVLDLRAMEFKRNGVFEEEIHACKVELEKKEYSFFERYKTYMEEFERKHIHQLDAQEMCDEVLIQELKKRGFKVERE